MKITNEYTMSIKWIPEGNENDDTMQVTATHGDSAIVVTMNSWSGEQQETGDPIPEPLRETMIAHTREAFVLLKEGLDITSLLQ